MNGTNNLAKNYFPSTFEDSTKFSLFLLGPRLSNFHQKFNFPKIAYNCEETLLLMNGTNNFAKFFFLAHFKIV